jgi:hypothetical protein
MRYLILIWSNPESRGLWDTFTPEQKAEGLRQYAAISAGLRASGELVIASPLADAAVGRRVTSRADGPPLTSDGPFAEAKEVLAGFCLVECASMERAVEIAATLPESFMGLIEVRPLRELDDLLDP